MELFRGFVPTKNKKCLMPFKNVDASKLKTLEEAEEYEEYAGILNHSTILIDIDDYEQSEILMNIVEKKQLACRVYETSRGKHFLFKNLDSAGDNIQKTCKTKTTLAIGLKSDVKVGCKNSYSIIKFKGENRKIIYDIFDDENYEAVPKWLLPVKYNVNFLTMEAGDGRNQALFNYILTLQSNGFTVEEVKETINIINDYILPDPLDQAEIETILRDDAFRKEIFFAKSKFLFDKFAMFIKNNSNIIKLNGQLHIYRDGIYVNDLKAIEAEMIKRIPGLKKTDRTETMAYLDLLVEEDTKQSGEEYIAFKNGIYNIITDEFIGFSPEYILTNKIDYDYIPDAYSEITDRVLDDLSCNDDSIRDLLEEVIGYTFYRRNELRKAFILIGDKANCKSTYLDMVKTLLGDNNTCALDLGELGDRFKTAELFHKLANIGDDIGDDFIPNPAIFKKLVSGDRLNAERKGKDPFDFNSYAKLLFSANNIPRIKDKSGAVMSRLIIIPFYATFDKNSPNFDPYIKYRLRADECMQYLIQVGLDGLKRVLHNQGFTISAKVQKELDEYEISNNPILLFLKEDNKVINEPTNQVYRKYVEFCISNSFNPMSNIEFSKIIRKKLGLDIVNKTIGGKKYRIFIRKGYENDQPKI
jgi:putative DNA primase/helicase